MANWVDEIHKKQDEFLQKMVDMWKKDERLKPLSPYFKWKTGEMNIAELTKDTIREMRSAIQRLSDVPWEQTDWELQSVIDAVDEELINIIEIKNIK